MAPEVPSVQAASRAAVSRSNSDQDNGPGFFAVSAGSSSSNGNSTGSSIDLTTTQPTNNHLLQDCSSFQPQRPKSFISDSGGDLDVSVGEHVEDDEEQHANKRYSQRPDRPDVESDVLPRAYRVRYDELFDPLKENTGDEFPSSRTSNKQNGEQRSLINMPDYASNSIDDISIDYTFLSLSPMSGRSEFSMQKHRNYVSRGKPPSEYTEEDLRVMPSDQNGSQENIFEYRSGGYKPTVIGEELGDYTVIRKLGFGHFSTVWLCSHKLEKEKYVAVKVVKSVHMCANMAREEIKLLNQLVNIEPKHPGRKYIIEMMDYFHVNSINGKHICIAFELMGPSLLHLITQSQYQGIYEGAVKSIIRQVLMGLTYLHDKCKVIHTDLKPENILIKVNDAYIKNMVDKATRYNELGIPMPRSYITSECYESQSFESHVTNTYVSPEYDPDHVVRSSSFPRLSDLTTSETEPHHGRRGHIKKELYVSPKIEVKIADMGNACWTNDKIQGTIQTKQYRALEVLLDSDYDLPADIWSVGCIAFELATGEFLFNPRNTQNYSASEDHILLIYELLGGIPSYISSRGRKSSRYFDSTGNLKICPLQLLHIWKTEDVLVEKYEWKRVHAIPFASMINAMIEPDPELRITAENALNMQWLKESSS